MKTLKINKNITEEDRKNYLKMMGKAYIELAKERAKKTKVIWLENTIEFTSKIEQKNWYRTYEYRNKNEIIILKIKNKWNPFKNTIVTFLQKTYVEDVKF